MLEVENLEVNYGHVKAVKKISFSVNKGEIVTILGSNGAGKTSTLFGVLNIVKSKGKVIFEGEDVSNKSTVHMVKKGIVLCPENRRIFSSLTVEENLKMGTYLRGDYSKNSGYVYDLFPVLKERRKQKAGSLSGGEQQMLALGRALMASPKLLMLDEPSLGLAPIIIDEIYSVLKTLKETNIPILLVEQNAIKSLKISDRTYILENGNVAHQGVSKEMLNDERLKKSYLGK
ncbi:amino acid ABC transporter ATPase [Petrotoga sp. HWH.PT.55.6.1]|uniref:ABC transporter ATP-binding protein n=1 Tax=unclassified Petrotoga TaxID=2620614 RepID=UPI000CC10B7B|nr:MULTISPECIES: ABC transporter ATP-binding protein [unclassified Petrotoga]PNR91646.1 amino acid ABC transporter ATP-binding protein [Petrotoga sp. HWHPT.55.6.3]RPD36585.1 amino acid ABC transporter ATPase [Petrotoga sp. HWH.PT.55.6.1]